MPDLTLEEIEGMRALEKAATPGPISVRRDGNQYIGTQYMPTAACVGASVLKGLVRPWNPHAAIAFGVRAQKHEEVRLLDADADYLTALRNAAPALLDMAEECLRLREQEKRVRACMFDIGLSAGVNSLVYEEMLRRALEAPDA